MHVKSTINEGTMKTKRDAAKEKDRLLAYNEGFKALIEKAAKDAAKTGGNQ